MTKISKPRTEETDSTPEWLYYNQDIPFDAKTYERLKDRVKLWADGKNPVEWACVLTGLVKGVNENLYEVVDDFYELPIYDVCRRQNQLAILVEDILKVHNGKKYIIGLLHTHPSGNLAPTPFDIYMFMHLDLQIGRSLRYLIVGPDSQQEIYHFQKLWDTGGFSDLSKKVQLDISRRKGGEHTVKED